VFYYSVRYTNKPPEDNSYQKCMLTNLFITKESNQLYLDEIGHICIWTIDS
jgi:hypothetical protein